MTRYLDPKNDLIFKRIFGEHEHLCMSLLNNMLPLDAAQQIVELTYLPPELVPEIAGLRNSIVDVRCTDNRGRQFIVEMQMHWTDSFKNRVLFNASKAYVKQLEKSEGYKLLQPVYALSFVNDTFDNDPETYYHHYQIVNIANTGKRIEGLEFVFVELPKFRPVNRAEKKLYDLWLTFLTRGDEAPAVLLEEDVTREAMRCLEISSYTRGELEAYDRYWDTIRVERTFYDDALYEGRAEGRAEGEAAATEKFVRGAHQRGLALEKIIEITGLSETQIKEIINELPV